MDTMFQTKCIAMHVTNQTVLKNIPATSKVFHLSLWSFDFSEKAKYGENGRFPTNMQYKSHVHSFLQNGYESAREAVDVRFGEVCKNEDDGITPFSVQFVDGQNKVLIMMSLIALLQQIEAFNSLS